MLPAFHFQQIPSLYVSVTHHSGGASWNEYEVNNNLNQREPLSIASETLRKSAAFIKSAIEIDENFWDFASDEARKEIFTDESYVKNHCNSVVLMGVAFWENREDRDKLNRMIELLTSTVFMNREFQGFVVKHLPWLDGQIKELVAKEEERQNIRLDRQLQQLRLANRLYQLEEARVNMQLRLLSH